MNDATAYKPQDRMWLWWLADLAHPVLVGELSLAMSGRAVALAYTSPWLESGFEMSEDLPLRPGLFVPLVKDRAAGAVDDARPDRWGERVIRKFERSPRLSILEFLLFAGDDRYGALGVSLSAEVYAPWPSAPLPGLSSLPELAEVVRKVLADEPVPEIERRLLRPGLSLGGARPKALIEIDGEPWIVKFSEGEAEDSGLIEHACMTLGEGCGINVARTVALPVGGAHAVAVRRFDRVGPTRLHVQSANVALQAAGEELGYPNLAQLMRRLAPGAKIAEQQEQLFRRMVFNILMDNTDDHEKNHALLRGSDGHYLLAPAFDVLPAASGLGQQAMLVGNAGAAATLDNAFSQARAFGLRPKEARQVVKEVTGVVSRWKDHFARAGVKARDIEMLEQYIDGDDLLGQRREFGG